VKDRVYKLNDTKGNLAGHGFYCPGCKCHHTYDVNRWNFNDDLKKPTFTPSLLIWKSRPEIRCHLFMTNGKIQYLNDCHHKYAGKIIDMEAVE